jgi:molybdopterin/thiamine biosynthesis adenylyltransferase
LVLDAEDAADFTMLEQLRADSAIEFIDQSKSQLSELRGLLPPPGGDLLDERCRWVYYPWRRTVVAVLGPQGFRAVRLDRNRNVITADEQSRLSALAIGVVGLSAGHVVAHTLAAEGLCGRLRLADFDQLELSNLNRVPATVLDIGLNKAEAAARRIAELDPYLSVEIMETGLTLQTVDEFLEGLNIVVEECDSLDMKAIVRERARARGIPVLMATSDRGLVDVERFDLEPQRPILHGLLGEVDPAALSQMTSAQKVPYLVRLLEAEQLSGRLVASAVEIDRILSSWPQVAGDVVQGATAIAEAVRRIGLGEDLRSGRTRLDVGSALDHLDQPTIRHRTADPTVYVDQASTLPGVAGVIVGAAIRAPSGGNAQPWYVGALGNAITIGLAPEHTSTIDVGLRGSAVALGAAVFNAKVAAAAQGVLGPVSLTEYDNAVPLLAVLEMGDGGDSHLADLYQPMLARETNRRIGTASPMRANTIEQLHMVSESEGATLHLLTSRDDVDAVATILAAADRIRYLSPKLHGDMASELRWPDDQHSDTGIDVRSLELDPGDLALLEILRRPDVMDHLLQWNAGTALGADTRRRITASSGLAVIAAPGTTLADYARGGSAVEAVWIIAQQHGLAVQPIAPAFLFAVDGDDFKELSTSFERELKELKSEFLRRVGMPAGATPALVLRLTSAEPASVRSRRSLDRVSLLYGRDRLR